VGVGFGLEVIEASNGAESEASNGTKATEANEADGFIAPNNFPSSSQTLGTSMPASSASSSSPNVSACTSSAHPLLISRYFVYSTGRSR